MSGVSQNLNSRRARYHPGIQSVAIYCVCFSVFFVIVSILIENLISSMMISKPRKNIGIMIYIVSISFFSIFSFKTSRSIVCIIPFFFVIILIVIPIALLLQESRNGFNAVKTPEDILPYCSKQSKEGKLHLPEMNKNKFVVFQPTNTGTGNRILGLVSSYALALITGRQLLVDWQTTSVFGANLFTLFHSDIIKPLSSILHNRTMKEDDYHFLNLVYCRQCTVRIRHPNFAFLASQDLNKAFTRKYIIVSSNVYFAPALMANIHYRDLLCAHFEPKHLFYSLYNRLLRLSPDLENELNETLKEYKNRNIIGIQIRTKDRVAFPDDHISSFLSCASYISARYENPLFFIASDSESLKRQASLHFGDKLFRLKKETHLFSEDGIKSAVLDMMILSRCKELVLTPFSTFGSVAAGIGEIVPHFITRKEGFCVQDLTSEPKFHYWHAMPQYSISSIGSSDMLNQDDSFM